MGRGAMAIATPGISGSLGEGNGVPDLLQLLGSGATGAILLALGERSLRTNELATQVPGYGPRTVYRYVSSLVELGVVGRDEEPGVPSKVVYRLTDPCGTELYGLVDLYSKMALPEERDVPHAWRPLKLLGDLWSSGMFEELNVAACTATELAALDHRLSFHQVRRRIDLYLIDEIIREAINGSRQRHYELTIQAREAMALVVGLASWRERYVEPEGAPGLTRTETLSVLRAVLPLVVLPEHVGKSLNLTVTPPSPSDIDALEVLRVEVDLNGRLCESADTVHSADVWGCGEIADWIEALLNGASNGIEVDDGDPTLLEAALQGMHKALWERPGIQASEL